MKNYDRQSIIKDFESRLTSGKLKRDSLENSFVKFNGDIKADNEAFARFTKTAAYKAIIAM